MTDMESALSPEKLYRTSRVWIWRAGLIIQVGLLGIIAFFIRPSSDPLILRYNAFFGVDLLGTWWQVYLIPGISLLFFIGNLGLAALLARRSAYLAATILCYGSLLIIFSGAIAVAALVSINS
ncbi:MAG: hypothetical protein E6Q06_03690 [Candidatus Moraniibacteriota bacterium]|nr:MAG: hypothetical protein E6Q06_03690 [Candidatus Moranbacteria bacterium]